MNERWARARRRHFEVATVSGWSPNGPLAYVSQLHSNRESNRKTIINIRSRIFNSIRHNQSEQKKLKWPKRRKNPIGIKSKHLNYRFRHCAYTITRNTECVCTEYSAHTRRCRPSNEIDGRPLSPSLPFANRTSQFALRVRLILYKSTWKSPRRVRVRAAHRSNCMHLFTCRDIYCLHSVLCDCQPVPSYTRASRCDQRNEQRCSLAFGGAHCPPIHPPSDIMRQFCFLRVVFFSLFYSNVQFYFWVLGAHTRGTRAVVALFLFCSPSNIICIPMHMYAEKCVIFPVQFVLVANSSLFFSLLLLLMLLLSLTVFHCV